MKETPNQRWRLALRSGWRRLVEATALAFLSCTADLLPPDWPRWTKDLPILVLNVPLALVGRFLPDAWQGLDLALTRDPSSSGWCFVDWPVVQRAHLAYAVPTYFLLLISVPRLWRQLLRLVVWLRATGEGAPPSAVQRATALAWFGAGASLVSLAVALAAGWQEVLLTFASPLAYVGLPGAVEWLAGLHLLMNFPASALAAGLYWWVLPLLPDTATARAVGWVLPQSLCVAIWSWVASRICLGYAARRHLEAAPRSSTIKISDE